MEYAVGTLNLQVRVEHSRSLKDKRQVLRSLKDRLRKHYNVSVAEVAHHESWQDSTVVAATVATTAHQAEQVLDAVHREAARILGRNLLDADRFVGSV